MQKRSLNGKVVVVTGGARGIGAETARALVRGGARVVIGDLDLDLAKQTAADLGGDTVALKLDVTDRQGFTAFLDEVEREVGPLYALVNNAGIMPVAFIDEETDETTGRQLAINLHAVIHGTREAVRRMKPRGTGHIVNVASLAGKAGFPGVATYSGTKFGVVGFSEAVRWELRGTGVEISCVMPGIVETELSAGMGTARLARNVTPQEVADAIVGALEKPKFDVIVPKVAGPLIALTSVLPRRGREALGRALKADQAMLQAVHSDARTAYEARAAESGPTADQEHGPRQ